MIGAQLAAAQGLMFAGLCFHPDSRVVAYTKKHLHDGEERTFVAGDAGPHLDIDGTQVGLAICAEINHASHIRDAVARGAAVYGASSFFTPSGHSDDSRTLLGYAESNRVVVVMANYTGASGGPESAGGSAIGDDTGTLLALAPPAGEYLLTAAQENSRWIARCVALARA